MTVGAALRRSANGQDAEHRRMATAGRPADAADRPTRPGGPRFQEDLCCRASRPRLVPGPVERLVARPDPPVDPARLCLALPCNSGRAPPRPAGRPYRPFRPDVTGDT